MTPTQNRTDLIVVASLQDNDVIAVYDIYQPVLVSNSARPRTSCAVFLPFDLMEPSHRS